MSPLKEHCISIDILHFAKAKFFQKNDTTLWKKAHWLESEEEAFPASQKDPGKK